MSPTSVAKKPKTTAMMKKLIARTKAEKEAKEKARKQALKLAKGGKLIRPQTDKKVIKKCADTLEKSYSAISLTINMPGNARSFSTGEKQQAAEVFDAEGDAIKAAKKLFDTKHPKFRAVVETRGLIYNLWRDNSLPYPEAGIRLFPRKNVESFVKKAEELRVQFNQAVEDLEDCYGELLKEAKRRLGHLFNLSDYPASLKGACGVSWTFHTLSPPDYLMQLKPEEYEAQKRQIQERLEQAVKLAEAALAEEFETMIKNLGERLRGTDDDGKPKVFKEASINNLREFFDKFRQISVRSNADLDEAVKKAHGLLNGVSVYALRASQDVRSRVGAELLTIQNSLSEMIVDKPRVRLIRKAKEAS